MASEYSLTKLRWWKSRFLPIGRMNLVLRDDGWQVLKFAYEHRWMPLVLLDLWQRTKSCSSIRHQKEREGVKDKRKKKIGTLSGHRVLMICSDFQEPSPSKRLWNDRVLLSEFLRNRFRSLDLCETRSCGLLLFLQFSRLPKQQLRGRAGNWRITAGWHQFLLKNLPKPIQFVQHQHRRSKYPIKSPLAKYSRSTEPNKMRSVRSGSQQCCFHFTSL